jgi:hypothetical protein
MKEKYMMEE